MAELKYVLTPHDFALFPTHVNHSQIGACLEGEVLGAGRCELAVSTGEIEMVRVRCFGKSATLRVGSRGEEDAAVISRYINGI